MIKDDTSQYIVLYADDDEDDVDLMQEAFSKYSTNMSVVAKNDGQEVLNFLKEVAPKKKLPCLVILDINMPRLDGKETLKQLRRIEDYNQVPIVLFTTSSSAEDARFAKKFNAGYLTKPMNANQIEFIADKFLNYCSEEVRKNILPG